ncbi:MAG: helicase-related protein [Endomicrobia bacterium]|nr:helicase-related protein [Endomicrobiia bacterium]MDW8055145.1 helicase-related protein [Elusimicrobiota bacterium]
MKNFITNSQTDNLKHRISELIKNSEELKFLVGFFYFSGLKELYISIKQNPEVALKILVGLNVDKINQQIVEYADLEDKSGHLSNEEIVNKFLSSIKKSINTENFDNKEFYEQVKFFIELIKNDKLIIRKTLRPNHAKLYIFKLKQNQVARNTLFITGSSNLTSSGLTTQEEFNVEISDYGFKEAEDYFDTLWGKAVKITEDNNYKKRLLDILEKETLIKEITPFEAYVLAVKMYLDSYERKQVGETLTKVLVENGYKPYKYQLDAIEQALAVIEKHKGVILADVVGLGKTIIACAIARELKKRGVIICPPSIIGDPRKKDAGWHMYKEQFGLYDWEIWSLGDLEKLQERIKKSKDFEVVIIDEAHRFRNQDTKSYEYLKNICRNKQVILLTATPFNNRPADILSLLKLFITPKKSSITLENNLVDKFRIFKGIFDRLAFIKKYYNSSDTSKKNKALEYYRTLFGEEFVLPDSLTKINQRAKYLSKQIRDVIEPVTIRRNRLDLKNNPYYKDEVKELSEVADPIEWFFELTKEQSTFYDEVIKTYFCNPEDGGKFKGAIYRPFEYEVGIKKISQEDLTEKQSFEYVSQFNLYDFMRRLLVKRFESSFGSFKESLKNFKSTTEVVLEFIQKTDKYILDRTLLERIYDKDLDEIEEQLKQYTEKIKNGEYPKNHKIYEISKFKHKDEFLQDIKSDLKLFDEILNKLENLKLIENDPKIECLINNLKEQLKKEPERKIVIFSEYVDTVKYLKPHLEKVFKNRVLTVAGYLSKHKSDEINKNFDASYEEQENKYDILLTSDKLSEGINLNRAGIVINYDIPWNPVRVIQRLGRINRISKKVFDVLYIVNFFPTEKGAELVKSREIASNKMFLIHNTLGEDAKIFDIDEEPTPSKLYQKIQQNPEKLEEETFYTKLLKDFIEIKQKHPQLVKILDKYPPRVKVAKKHKEDEVIVFIRKGWLYICCGKYNNQTNKIETAQISFEDAYEKILCSKEEQSLSLTDKFWDIYEEIKNLRETYYLPTTEKSLEQKAINTLKSLLRIQNNDILEHRDFINMLLEDITDYGTLSDYTLRRIANLEAKTEKDIEETIKELNLIKHELGGEFYLEKEKQKNKDLTKEIIVAIENQKPNSNQMLNFKV